MLVNGQIEVESVNGKVSEFSEDIEIVEEILRRYHGDQTLRVMDIQCSPGSKDGDNYMSLIKRIVAKVKSTQSNAGECVSVHRRVHRNSLEKNYYASWRYQGNVDKTNRASLNFGHLSLELDRRLHRATQNFFCNSLMCYI